MTPSQALQRVAVRMLYDPTLVARVYAGHTPAPLTDAQADMLRAQPRGAWGTDPYRPSRTLQALIEEYPASASLTGARPLHRFFQGETFHGAIMDRRVLALAFGDWIAEQAGPVARFEQAIAALRRRRAVPLAGGQLRCAPHLWPISLPEGTVAAWQGLQARLGPQPLQALLAPGYAPPPPPRLGEGQEHWLLEVDSRGQIQLGAGSAGLNGLLSAAIAPADAATLAQAAMALGAESLDEAAEICSDLREQGLLVGSAAGARQ